MFKEIAVDPAAVSTSYRDFSYIIEKFGISEGRLIAAFPSKWKKFVYDAAQTRLRGTIELTKLEHRLRDLPSEVFMSRGRPGEGCTQNWLHAAVQEHRRVPFEAIIASERIDEAGVILATELDGEHPCLQPNRQWHVPRQAVDMADCCGPLLASGRHIKLVDPHFDAGTPRFRRPFLELLKRVKTGSRVDVSAYAKRYWAASPKESKFGCSSALRRRCITALYFAKPVACVSRSVWTIKMEVIERTISSPF
jgi:hypothetical protein